MTPLGLAPPHGGRATTTVPAPGSSEVRRADWTSVYYHRADASGIGFDRTSTGSNAVAQYFPPVADAFSRLDTVPEKYLLWFHHVGWGHRMASGRTLWEELVGRYHAGSRQSAACRPPGARSRAGWTRERFEQVGAFLAIQENEARWWRDASVLYFQAFSGRPLPEGHERPEHDLAWYQAIRKRYVPGN